GGDCYAHVFYLMLSNELLGNRDHVPRKCNGSGPISNHAPEGGSKRRIFRSTMGDVGENNAILGDSTIVDVDILNCKISVRVRYLDTSASPASPARTNVPA